MTDEKKYSDADVALIMKGVALGMSARKEQRNASKKGKVNGAPLDVVLTVSQHEIAGDAWDCFAAPGYAGNAPAEMKDIIKEKKLPEGKWILHADIVAARELFEKKEISSTHPITKTRFVSVNGKPVGENLVKYAPQ